MKRIVEVMRSHKVISGIFLLVFVAGLFSLSSSDDEVVLSYETIVAEKGVIMSTVSGMGQAQAETDFTIKAEVAGDVIYVGAKEGDFVNAGKLLIRLDDTEAQKKVRDAEVSLESAELSLEKLLKPASNLSLLQARNDVEQAIENQQDAEKDLEKEYEDVFNTISDVFLDLPTIMTNLESMLYDTDFTLGQKNLWYYRDLVDSYDKNVIVYQEELDEQYNKTRESYEDMYSYYANLSRYSSQEETEELLNRTYDGTKEVADLIKKINNYIDFVKDILVQKDFDVPPLINTHLASLETHTGKTNSHLSSLLSAKNGLNDAKNSIVNTQRDMLEKQEQLEELEAGADDLDIRSQELTVKQRQYALEDEQETLADYYIYAPFDGIVSNIQVQKYESVGTNAEIATFLTKEKTVVISFNEIDAAIMKKGQKATLVFDALDGVTAVGEVVEVDTIGVVSQGVVSYDVTVSFEIDDSRIKPGMSAEATVVTNMSVDAISVPSSAVKKMGDNWYVEILTQKGDGGSLVEKRNVEIGISSDIDVEIIFGVSVGEQIITKTTEVKIEDADTDERQTSFLPTGGGNRMR